VGGRALPNFLPLIEKYIKLELFNDDDDTYLNKDCGADYVKTNKLFPKKYQSRPHNSFVSFDGDADRIVF